MLRPRMRKSALINSMPWNRSQRRMGGWRIPDSVHECLLRETVWAWAILFLRECSVHLQDTLYFFFLPPQLRGVSSVCDLNSRCCQMHPYVSGEWHYLSFPDSL